jgi:hypothetical protein
MAENVKNLKSISVNEIEIAISEALEKFCDFQPKTDIRLFELIKKTPQDYLGHDRFRVEMLVDIPRYDPKDSGIDF